MSDVVSQKVIDDMVADLYERATRLYRKRSDAKARVVGRIAAELQKAKRPESEYIRALGFAGVISEDRRACLNSIRRGEFPADSIPARVTKMLADDTTCIGATAVLYLIGCKADT